MKFLKMLGIKKEQPAIEQEGAEGVRKVGPGQYESMLDDADEVEVLPEVREELIVNLMKTTGMSREEAEKYY